MLHRAIVVDNDDPERRGRIRVKIPTLLYNADIGDGDVSDWAEPCWTTFRRDIPPNGTGVWVTFEHNVPERCIWVGMMDYMPGGLPETPNLAQQNHAGKFPFNRGLFEAKTEDLSDIGGSGPKTIVESSAFQLAQTTIYPNNTVDSLPGGGIVEERDVSNNIQRYHRLVGYNELEAMGDGREYHRATAKQEFLVTEQKYVDGDVTEVVAGETVKAFEGPLSVSTSGLFYRNYGDLVIDAGSFTVNTAQRSALSVKSFGAIDMDALTSINVTASVAAMFSAADVTVMGSDITINTSATGTLLMSGGNSATIAVSKLGGRINLGTYVPPLSSALAPTKPLRPALAIDLGTFNLLLSYLTSHTHPPGGGPVIEGTALVPSLSACLSNVVYME